MLLSPKLTPNGPSSTTKEQFSVFKKSTSDFDLLSQNKGDSMSFEPNCCFFPEKMEENSTNSDAQKFKMQKNCMGDFNSFEENKLEFVSRGEAQSPTQKSQSGSPKKTSETPKVKRNWAKVRANLPKLSHDYFQ